MKNRAVNLPTRANRLYGTLFLSVGAIFLFVLSVTTVILTHCRYPICEDSTLRATDMLPFLVGLMIWLVAALLLRRSGHVPHANRTALIAFLTGLILSVLWVFVSNSGPTYDSLDLSCAALRLPGSSNTIAALGNEWAEHSRGVWGTGAAAGTTQYSYMGRFPFQAPYMLVLWVCQLIAGDKFAVLAQLLNASANAFTMYLVCKIVDELGGGDFAVLLSLGLLISFCPLTLFATFIYGNLLCLPLGLGCWLLCLRAMRDEVTLKQRVVRLLCAGALLAAAILMKSTMTVLAIAFAVSTLVFALRRRSWQLVPLAIIPLLLSSLMMEAILVPLEMRTGTNLHDGPPKLVWVVMGTGASKEYNAWKTGESLPTNDLVWPGYFDAYVWVKPEEEGYASWSELNHKALALRLEHFLKDPGYAAAFFGKKLAIEWLDPTCECFVVSNYVKRPEGDFGTRLADDHRTYTFFASSIYYGKANAAICYLADLAQSLIAIGAFAWCLQSWERRDEFRGMELLSLVYVLGAALLYVFCENKSQYILPYYLILIPYAAAGWRFLCDKASTRIGKWREASASKREVVNE